MSRDKCPYKLTGWAQRQTFSVEITGHWINRCTSLVEIPQAGFLNNREHTRNINCCPRLTQDNFLLEFLLGPVVCMTMVIWMATSCQGRLEIERVEEGYIIWSFSMSYYTYVSICVYKDLCRYIYSHIFITSPPSLQLFASLHAIIPPSLITQLQINPFSSSPPE